MANITLTRTEVQSLCNVAKELANKNLSNIDNISFVNISIGLIGSEVTKQQVKGTTSLDGIYKHAINICDLYSFEAYAMEEIKRLNELTPKSKEEWMEEMKYKAPEEPIYPSFLSSQSYFKQFWSNEDKFLYYKAQTFCSKLGMLIHPDGAIHTARKQYLKSKINSIITEGKGSDTILKYVEPSISEDKIDELFNSLSAKRRSAEKELNKYNSRIQKECDNYNAKLMLEYEEKRSEYLKYRDKLDHEYYEYKINTLDQYSKKKVSFPESMKETITSLQKVISE